MSQSTQCVRSIGPLAMFLLIIIFVLNGVIRLILPLLLTWTLIFAICIFQKSFWKYNSCIFIKITAMKQNQIFLFENHKFECWWWMTIMNSLETVINDHDEEWYWNNGDVLYVAQCQRSNNKCSFQISGG